MSLEVALSRQRTLDEYKEAMSTVLTEINRLSLIVSDLLLLSSLDTHNKNSKRERLNLATVLESVYELMQPLFSDKQIRSSLSIVSDAEITGDTSQLSQVFINLLENAIKYTPAGGTIELSLAQADSYAIVSVQDSGQGFLQSTGRISLKGFTRSIKQTSRINKAQVWGLRSSNEL